MPAVAKKKITRRPRQEREADICAAAKAAFATHGYQRAVMSDIAHAAGVAEGTVYKLFENKRALLYRVIEDWYRDFIDGLAKNLRGVEEPTERLRYLIWYHLQLVKDDPALCRVFFREIRTYDDYRGSAMYKLNQDYTTFTVNVLREGVAAGVFRNDIPPALIRDTIFGGLEHYVWLYLAGDKKLDVEATTKQFWELIVRGIASGKPRGRGDFAPVVARLEAVADKLEQR